MNPIAIAGFKKRMTHKLKYATSSSLFSVKNEWIQSKEFEITGFAYVHYVSIRKTSLRGHSSAIYGLPYIGRKNLGN
jgi:hypothetical protein